MNVLNGPSYQRPILWCVIRKPAWRSGFSPATLLYALAATGLLQSFGPSSIYVLITALPNDFLRCRQDSLAFVASFDAWRTQ